MHHKTFSLVQLYKISFVLFFIVPIVSVIIKTLNGMFKEGLQEIWFLAFLLISSGIIYALPNINKLLKARIMFFVISIIVFFFGLGAIGFQTDFVIVDFTDESRDNKLPYIFMFIILVIQFLSIAIHGYIEHKFDKIKYDSNYHFVMNKGLYIMMATMVVLSYVTSIVVKLITSTSDIYIHFDLGILLGYIFFYVSLTIIAKFQFKQSLSDASINALFFVPILSIGLGLGILLFQENFVYFKLTPIVCGTVNLLIFIMNLTLIRKKQDI
jgi:hypothetical protein